MNLYRIFSLFMLRPHSHANSINVLLFFIRLSMNFQWHFYMWKVCFNSCTFIFCSNNSGFVWHDNIGTKNVMQLSLSQYQQTSRQQCMLKFSRNNPSKTPNILLTEPFFSNQFLIRCLNKVFTTKQAHLWLETFR